MTGKRSQYFQTIARFFFEQRRSPFFLSSKELDLIDTWEKTGIPLRVVLEGIKESFENIKMRPGKKKKIFSLTFCNACVLKSFEQHREKRVGRKRKVEDRTEKQKRVKKEVRRFLNCIPENINYLRAVYSQIYRDQLQKDFDEAKLEQEDERIEGLLVQNASDEEKEKVRKDILGEFRVKNKDEFDRIFGVKLVKHLRKKYKIPYISPFYY